MRRRRGPIRRLEPTAARGGAVGHRVRGLEASREHVAARFQHVAGREAVGDNGDVDKPSRREQTRDVVSVVAAKVSGFAIGRAESVSPGRHADQKPAAGPDPRAPLGDSGGVVLDVLQHLERAHEIERSARSEHRKVALDDLLHAGGVEASASRRERRRVGLEPGVRVAASEHDTDRALPSADLQHRTDSCGAPQAAEDRVVAQPRVQGQSRCHPRHRKEKAAAGPGAADGPGPPAPGRILLADTSHVNRLATIGARRLDR